MIVPSNIERLTITSWMFEKDTMKRKINSEKMNLCNEENKKVESGRFWQRIQNFYTKK